MLLIVRFHALYLHYPVSNGDHSLSVCSVSWCLILIVSSLSSVTDVRYLVLECVGICWDKGREGRVKVIGRALLWTSLAFLHDSVNSIYIYTKYSMYLACLSPHGLLLFLPKQVGALDVLIIVLLVSRRVRLLLIT